MRPGVRADGVAGRINLLGDFRIVGRVLAYFEEDAGGALIRQRLEDRRRIGRPWTVIESQHDLLFLEEVQFLEMLEAEAGAACRVDLDGAGHTERVRIGARSSRRLRRLLRSGGSRSSLGNRPLGGWRRL